MLKLDALTCVIGLRGSGKSFLARKIAYGFYPRLIVFDTKDEYDDSAARGRHASPVYTLQGLGAALCAAQRKPYYRIIFKCGYLSGDENQRFEDFNRAIDACNIIGDNCVLIEEAQMWATKHTLPEALRWRVLVGRSHGCAGIFVTQRPAEMHTTLLSQAENIFCGKLFESNDIKYLRNFLGDNADRLSSLNDFNFIHYSPGLPATTIKS